MTIKDSIESVDYIFKNINFDYKEDPLERQFYDYIKKYSEEYSYLCDFREFCGEETLNQNLYFALKKGMKLVTTNYVIHYPNEWNVDEIGLLNFVPEHMAYFERTNFYDDEEKPERDKDYTWEEYERLFKDRDVIYDIKDPFKEKKAVESLVVKWKSEGRMLTEEELIMEIK